MNDLPVSSIPNTLLGELERMRSMASSEAMPNPNSIAGMDDNGGFAALLRGQVDQVNALQKNSAKVAEMFEVGNENVSLVDVMIAGQKSKVAFTALVEVRNKMLTAYQDVMNMQV